MLLESELWSRPTWSGHVKKAQRKVKGLEWIYVREREREADVGKVQTLLILKCPFWFLVQFSCKCLLKAPSFCCSCIPAAAFRARWWQIESYLISFIVSPSGGVYSKQSKSCRADKQPACLMDYRGHLLCLLVPSTLGTACYSNQSICKRCPFTPVITLTDLAVIKSLQQVVIVNWCWSVAGREPDSVQCFLLTLADCSKHRCSICPQQHCHNCAPGTLGDKLCCGYSGDRRENVCAARSHLCLQAPHP